MATAKPSRNRKQPSPKTPSKAQIRQQRKQQSLEATDRMAAAAYLKTYRRIQVAIARQEAKRQAMSDAGFKPQQQQSPATPQQQPTSQKKAPPKPAAKASKSGRKPPSRRR